MGSVFDRAPYPRTATLRHACHATWVLGAGYTSNQKCSSLPVFLTWLWKKLSLGASNKLMFARITILNSQVWVVGTLPGDHTPSTGRVGL